MRNAMAVSAVGHFTLPHDRKRLVEPDLEDARRAVPASSKTFKIPSSASYSETAERVRDRALLVRPTFGVRRAAQVRSSPSPRRFGWARHTQRIPYRRVGDGYLIPVRDVLGESPENGEEHAALQRVRCYRFFAETTD